MKRILAIVFSSIFGISAFAAPAPLFRNVGVITNAVPIDATTFLNLGTFSNIASFPYPYDMQHVRFFTNRGTMTGSMGFQIDHIDPESITGIRRPLDTFNNSVGATISGFDDGLEIQNGFLFNFNFFGITQGAASHVKVSATNIVNRGKLSVGTIGLLELTGKTVDLSRGALSAGDLFGISTNSFFFNNFGFVFFFGQNSYGVDDIYGGAGEQTIDLSGQFIGGNALGYFPPSAVFSPFHNVQFRTGPNGGIGSIFNIASVFLPQSFPADFEAHANITDFQVTPNGVDKVIQVVFVKTNFIDTNITAQVRFVEEGFPGQLAIVELSTPEFDPISGQNVTNAIYVLDNAAEFGSIFPITNFFGNSSVRPSNYQITTSTPFEWPFGFPGNTIYDPLLIYHDNNTTPGSAYEDKEVDAFYAGYAAQVGRNPELASGVTTFTNIFGIGLGGTNLDLFLFPDPTNQPGRIEINADNLDLTLARIRSEGLLSLNAKHLKGGGAAEVSAGIINADLGSTNGSMIISNIFPTHFKRVRGDVYAYSAIWNNTETNAFETNNNRFHVLILDHNLKADFKPTIRNLTLRSTNLVVKDDITVNRNARFVAEDLTFTGTVTLAEDATTVGAENFVGLRNFLNESNAVFQGADVADFGFDTVTGLDSITNRGTMSATALSFKATSFHNSGLLLANNPGSIFIEADTAELLNGTNSAGDEINISAQDLTVTNSVITVGEADASGQLGFGRLILNVTNKLTDGGAGANNVWQVSDGFQLPTKPFEGDLRGTEIRTIASSFQEALHVWAGQDVGPGPDGFFNNVALGRLILDVQSPNATLHFSGPDLENEYALYVVNLDLNLGASLDVNTSLNNLVVLDDNIRIYFINSNDGEKLTNAFPNMIQVPAFDLDTGLAPLALTVNGLGVITPNLDGKDLKIGDTYQLKARPGAGQTFRGWSGGTNSSNSTLTFRMRRNLALDANFGPNPLDPFSGNYNGLFYDATNGVSHETAGFLNLKLRKKGAFTGKILLGKPYPFHGTFLSSGSANVSVHRAGKSPLQLSLQLDMTNNSDQVQGTVTIDGQVATLVADRASTPIPTSKYTMVIPGGVAPAPSVDGIGTVDVDAKGGLRLKGTLADGTRVNQSVSISKNGEWPLYLPLYHGFGSIWSRVTFTNEVSNSFHGDLNWFKKAVPGRNFQSGFTNVSSVIGSSYSASEPILGIVGGTVTLSGGNLTDSVTNDFTLSSDNVVSATGTNQLSIQISLPTGLFNGNFVHPDTKKTTSIKGVILQQQNNGRGFFLGTDQSGAVILEGN